MWRTRRQDGAKETCRKRKGVWEGRRNAGADGGAWGLLEMEAVGMGFICMSRWYPNQVHLETCAMPYSHSRNPEGIELCFFSPLPALWTFLACLGD